MGWKNYYAMGLQAPGYSKHAIHTKHFGNVFVGATASDLQATAKSLANDSGARFYGVAFDKTGKTVKTMRDPTPESVSDDPTVIADLKAIVATRPAAAIERWFGTLGDEANSYAYVAYFDRQDQTWPAPIGEFGSKILTAPVIVPTKQAPTIQGPPKPPDAPASHAVAKAGLAIGGAILAVALMAKH